MNGKDGAGAAVRVNMNGGKITFLCFQNRIGVASPGYGYYENQVLQGVNGGT